MKFPPDSKVAFRSVNPQAGEVIWVTGVVLPPSPVMASVPTAHRDVRTTRWNEAAGEAQEHVAMVQVDDLVWANELVPCPRCTRIHKPEKANEPCHTCKQEKTDEG